MYLKNVNRMVNCVDPDQTASFRSSLIWIYTVCADMPVGIIMVNGKCFYIYIPNFLSDCRK